ncbi:MAG: 16S rRNA (cytosine(1402)-N(4))-methyltransferase [Candidatus Pelagibacter sp. TMED275]|nr:MAG: 16S rRNA (cytosine(1402)-N(4))-methyltransferase [Candidatus Pelagibacter sp. TMED275]
MNATILLEKKKHFPVLLNEIISIISPQYGGTFLDCTFGQGGYTKKILEFKNTNVIGIDRDSDTFKAAKEIKKKYSKRFEFYNKKFSEIGELDGKNKFRCIIFDLGFSLNQIKDETKGLSFNSKGKLNMSMGLNSFTANEAIHSLDLNDLNKIFKFFGEDKEARIIAKKIINLRQKQNINNEDLINIIESSKKKNFKKNKSTKIFQSLRMFVNQEISELIKGLIAATKLLEPGGMIIVVSFHSIEDRIVKFFFNDLSSGKNLSRYLPGNSSEKKIFEIQKKKPIIPSNKEINTNPASRSAKLRYAIKLTDIDDYELKFYNKFKFLLDIENLSKKI